jgi:hypothetical protein
MHVNKPHLLAATAVATTPSINMPSFPFSDHCSLHGNAFNPATGQKRSIETYMLF